MNDAKHVLRNSFGTQKILEVGEHSFQYHSLPTFAASQGHDLTRLPYSLKILLENLLRQEDGIVVKAKHIEALAHWDPRKVPTDEIQFMPARVLLQDFTGVPAVADLAAMRAALHRLGGDPNHINPWQPADLVVDHSVQVDSFGSIHSFHDNAELEFSRNRERYQFLKWGQTAFKNFRVVPPDTGIVHQINLEFLAHVVMTRQLGDGLNWAFPDSLVGTDSHTTMINGLGVLGWGVGGIEAEAALLGQPCSMLVPNVVGMKLSGTLPTGTTATDLVLTITQILRKRGVVGKFVEFFGSGLSQLSLADRATIANMAPEYGATVGLFPVDQITLNYLQMTGRAEKVPLVEAYFKAQNLWYDAQSIPPDYSDLVELDLATIVPSVAGPARPQDRLILEQAPASFQSFLNALPRMNRPAPPIVNVESAAGESYPLGHGAVVIAAITSCTNTSNPSVMMAAGLLAKNAVERGLSVQPWVKTSLAPGSAVVTSYLKESGLLPYLEALKFHVVGYGCTTCIGNSGPLAESITQAIVTADLAVVSVLSGNRNFEGRVNPHVRANYLASPPLVVAYAIAGNIGLDLTKEPLGLDPNGAPIFLADIWPSPEKVVELVNRHVHQQQFTQSYADVFSGQREWQSLAIPTGEMYAWDPQSTYIKEPPFFNGIQAQPALIQDVTNARVLVMLGDSITTDHISPAGNISKLSPAGSYLIKHGVVPADFNGYGARRGNHEVMVRGTFANVRLKNHLVPGVEGGVTLYHPEHREMSIFDASELYAAKGVPLVVLAGKEYGSGSSRDWAAKGPKLLGIRAVIAESFERIHRSNLVGMGILPLQYLAGQNAETLKLKGDETFHIRGLNSLSLGQALNVELEEPAQEKRSFEVQLRIDTPNELEYFRHGGILPYVLRQSLKLGA